MCTKLVLTVSAAEYNNTVDALAVKVKNPTEFGCNALGILEVRVIKQPAVESITSQTICVAENNVQVTLGGSHMLRLNNVLPHVTVEGKAVDVIEMTGCVLHPLHGHKFELCTGARIQVEKNKEVTDVQQRVVAMHNSCVGCCSGIASARLLVFPPPRITAYFPSLCSRNQPQYFNQEYSVSGTHFVKIDGTPPEVTMGGRKRSLTLSSCTPLDGYSNKELCTEMLITINDVPNTFDAGKPIIIQNPSGCVATSDKTIFADDRAPKVTSFAPTRLCSDLDGQTLTVSGEFPKVSGELTLVYLSGKVAPLVKGSADCDSDPNGMCTDMTVETPNGMNSGKVVIKATAACEMDPQDVKEVDVISTPIVTTATPAEICETKAVENVLFTGSSLVPAVTLSMNSKSWNIERVDDCVVTNDVELCKTMSVVVTGGSLDPGYVRMSMDNGNTDCLGTNSKALQIIRKPVIESISPHMCFDTAGQVTVKGKYFRPEKTLVMLVDATGVDVGTTYPATSVLNYTGCTTPEYAKDSLPITLCTSVIVTFKSKYVPPGLYNVILQTGPECLTRGSSDITIRVHPQVIAFFVDPTISYNGVQTDVAIFTSGLLSQAAVVRLYTNTSEAVYTPSNMSYVIEQEEERFNRIRARFPSGLDPGKWSLQVISEIGCRAELKNAFEVTDKNLVKITRVDPGFVWTETGGAIQIIGSESPGAGFYNFISLPRVYISPTAAGTGATGVPLGAIALISPVLITVSIPPGLAPGTYDVVLVDPANGLAGVLKKAVVINALPTPTIDTVLPSSILTSDVTSLTITGNNFDTDGVTVKLICIAAGVTTTYDLSSAVTEITPTQINVDSASGKEQYSVCLVSVTNSDGAVIEFASISVVNPSRKLAAPVKSASTMIEARRGHALVGAKVSSVSAYLWALGGDDGSLANRKDTVERAQVSKYGQLSSWAAASRNNLPLPLSWLTANTISSFIYIAGGFNSGNGASAAIFRTSILKQAHTVGIEGEILVGVDSTDWPDAGGTYYYRIAILYAENDSENPGGESLPGDFFSIRLPPNVPGLSVKLVWKVAPAAVGYRIYRTSKPNENPSELELLIDIPVVPGQTPQYPEPGAELSFIDRGIEVQAGVTSPYVNGELAQWSDLSVTCPTCVVHGGSGVGGHSSTAHLTSESPEGIKTYHLYLLGGQPTATGSRNSASSSLTICIILVTPASGTVREAQTVERCYEVPSFSAVGAFNSMTLSVDPRLGLASGSKGIILSAGGRLASTLTWASVDDDDSDVTAESGPKIDTLGTCLGSENGFLYILGGSRSGSGTISNSVPTTGAKFAPIDSCGQNGCSFGKFNAMGGSKVHRIFHACVSINAQFFLSGGFGRAVASDTTADAILKSLEQVPH